MTTNRQEVLAAAAPAVLMATLLGAAAGLLAATLSAPERQALWNLLEPRLALFFLLWLVASIAAGAAARHAWLHFGAAPGRLAEDVQLLLTGAAPDALQAQGSAGSRALAVSIHALALQRDSLRADIAAQVAAASRAVAQERNRLAALMSELTQSVVVCRLDGRVLLFNARARQQFTALAMGHPAAAADSKQGRPIGGTEAQGLGLGRSIYSALDPRLVAHALRAVQQRMQRGAAQPSAQFVTATRSGQLLRVQLAPVRANETQADATTPPALSGFVLMLDNITQDQAQNTERDRLLHSLTEGHRGSLANLQAAVELLDDPALDSDTRERFRTVVHDEISTMGQRLNEAATQGLRSINTRWPLEDMLGADLVAAAAQRMQTQLSVQVTASDVDPLLWLKVDSYHLIQALLHLAGRLTEGHAVRHLQLQLAAADGKAQLDLAWPAQAINNETLAAWESEAMQLGDETLPLTVRDVVERHGGALWLVRGSTRREALFRFLLPLADATHAPADTSPAQTPGPQDGRLEFYDFDLFAGSDSPHALDECRLLDLVYTVFDTETTGMQPSAGDEIIQIGATRLVNGRLLRGETFLQLVNPQRSIPSASIAIHGITPEMVADQPHIGEVLPVFHGYAQGSVLVAHNAAFDMRFLQLKETTTGIVFEQPVLDTLLLAAVVQPNQDSHRLEALAERFKITISGRHSALGDALVTAEVFLKLLPLLAEKGIHTLGQARSAAQETALARIQY